MSAPTLPRPRPGRAWPAGPSPSPRRRRLTLRRAERVALAALALAALAGFLLYPTYPNYDSVYSLLWGRELLDGRRMTFDAYRAPTQHPLAIALGAVLSLFGTGADRAFVAFAVGSFVVLLAGLYTLGKAAFTPLVGALAALLLATRFDFAFLAARGYIDPAYLALVVWAAVLEVRRPRRGTAVLVLLALAGLLRPEGWVLAGLYFLWVAWPAPWRNRVRYALLCAAAPVLWGLTDLVVTGDPLFSLHGTSELAAELGRNKGAGAVPTALWAFLLKLAKLPVVLGGAVGLVVAVVLVPLRARVPVVLLVVGVATFALVGGLGLSVIDRYLLVPSLMVMVLCGVAFGGWTLLREGLPVRRAWAALAVALVVAGVAFTAVRLNLTRLDGELAFRADAHDALAAALAHPSVAEGLRCGDLHTPNHKLVPEVRWLLDLPEERVLARSSADAGEPRRGVALLVHTRDALFRQALVGPPGEDTRHNLPPAGFARRHVTRFYSVYVRCP
ncbi:MAG: hypothetical protein M3P39_07685 [Actinomycetota bacterium]|nr:hypothetical protein [Actinomycetota bacterium]